MPANSNNEGAKSTLRVVSESILPALTSLGYFIIRGIRKDSSYIKRLSYQPCSPRKKP